MIKYKFSQSGLKDLEDPINCPFRWKASHIDHTESYELGEAAQMGKYFEYLCLGTDTGCTSIPRLKSGLRSTIDKRIIAQADIFKSIHNPESSDFSGEVVFKTDMTLTSKNRKGIIDYSTENEAGEITWMDLKLVSDLYRGYYMYGHHMTANYDQQIFYKKLIMDNGYKYPKMGLFIFESGTKSRTKKIMLNISDKSLDMMNIRVQAAEEVITKYEETEWVKVPDANECKKCSISNCKVRMKEIPAVLPEELVVTEKGNFQEQVEFKI